LERYKELLGIQGFRVDSLILSFKGLVSVIPDLLPVIPDLLPVIPSLTRNL